jgi:hypothetical protein
MINARFNISVLQHVKKDMVESLPYPYLVIADALPAQLAEELTSTFPLDLFDRYKAKLTDTNNKRIDITIADSRNIGAIPPIWREFLEYHSSAAFMQEVMTIFGAHITKAFSKFYPSQAALNSLTAGLKGIDNFSYADLLLDTAISINTPVHEVSAVRAIHTDHGDKLFSGLFYLRRPEDDSTGGNLQIHRWKDGYSHLQKRILYQEGVNPKHTELVKEIRYDNNVFVLFINSLDALHAVTPRAITPYDRTFVNFVGESKHKLFRKELSIAKKVRKILGSKITSG